MQTVLMVTIHFYVLHRFRFTIGYLAYSVKTSGTTTKVLAIVSFSTIILEQSGSNQPEILTTVETILATCLLVYQPNRKLFSELKVKGKEEGEVSSSFNILP